MTRRLFELVTRDGISISPYVWRTKYALAAKGLDYESCGIGFVDIPVVCPPNAGTLPILQDFQQRFICDSWEIAAYLDETYGDPLLFSCEREHSLVLFFDRWLSVEVVPNLLRICALDIYNRLRNADQIYFRHSREVRLGRSLESAHAERERYLPKVRRALEPMRVALRHSAFVGGASPSYADFIAAGAFIWAGSVATIHLLEADDPMLEWLDRCLGLFGGIGSALSLVGLGRSH